MKKETYYFACDFETTTDPDDCRVWSVAFTQLFVRTEDVVILGSIDEFFKSMEEKLPFKTVLYFHNLKFDGSFIVDYLLKNSYVHSTGKVNKKQFSTSVTALGTWYSIRFNNGYSTIEIRDSLKLLPFSLKQIGKGFKTKHQKTTMNYNKLTSLSDCSVDDINYIKNDVLVLREALEVMLKEGHNKLTIGSCCMEEFKSLNPNIDYMTPDLSKIQLPDIYGSADADYYIRKGYRGGYCYVGKEGYYVDGSTFDVNSLYPSVMHSKSGNRYPFGEPSFWKGNYIPTEAYTNNRVFIVRFKARFRLKEGYLPTVQIKDNHWYSKNEYLKTNQILIDNKYEDYVYDKETDTYTEVYPTITMTSVDFQLFLEHYNVQIEILDGCWFETYLGLFDSYIDKWSAIKMTSKGAIRQIAKLFLNNLYGKLSTSRDSSFKVPYIENGIVKFEVVHQSDKKLVHIGMGAFVTAYARIFTITAAQKNYDNFCYADTDSIHVITHEPIGIEEHDTALLCWKRECDWSEAIFLRQKTYAERVISHDGEKCKPEWDIKACGCPPRAKNLFLEAIDRIPRVEDKTEEESQWLQHHRLKIRDFKKGLSVPGKLRVKRVPGGIVLTPCMFTIR